jgi:hypothetical protein
MTDETADAGAYSLWFGVEDAGLRERFERELDLAEGELGAAIKQAMRDRLAVEQGVRDVGGRLPKNERERAAALRSAAKELFRE